jgi:hypothetical protein
MDPPVKTINGRVDALVVGAKEFPTVGRTIVAVDAAVGTGAAVAVGCEVG